MMIDFNLNIQAETLLWHSFFFLFFYLWAFFSNRDLLYHPKDKRKAKGRSVILYICTIILTIAAYTRGDFFHYAEVVQTGNNIEHMESIYIWLTKVVHGNYLLWRLMVFGGALLLYQQIIKRFGLESRLSTFVFLICFILVFNYARASLAFAVYFYGLSYLIKPSRNRILGYVFGIVILTCSQFFHNSAIVLIVLTPIILTPLNKWPMILMVVVVALLYVNKIYDSILEYMWSIEGEETANVFLYYQQNEAIKFQGGLSGSFMNLLEYGLFYAPFFIITKDLFFNHIKADSVSIILYKVLFGIILIATVFALSSTTTVYFYRVLYMGLIPLCVELVYMFEKEFLSKTHLRFCVYFGLTYCVYSTLYGIYLKLI